MANIDLPGAELLLSTLRLLTDLDDDRSLDASYKFTTSRYNYDTGDFDEVGPHFEAWLDCSDTFFWGSGDMEEVTDANLPVLEGVVADLKPLYEAGEAAYTAYYPTHSEALMKGYHEWAAKKKPKDATWGQDPEFKRINREHNEATPSPSSFLPVGDLYAARVRTMRPQGAAYKVRYAPVLWDLFNAAGPEREVGMGNPYPIGEAPNYDR